MLEKKLKAGILTKGSQGGIEKEVLIENIVGHIDKYKLNIFLGPEWLFLPKDRFYSESEKDDIIMSLAQKTSSVDTLIIPGSIMWEDKDSYYNAAPIIHGGILIGEAYKDCDGGTENRAKERFCKKRRYRPRDYKNADEMFDRTRDGVFKWEGYDIGVEICCDQGHIKTGLKTSNLDFYFLVSCGLGIIEGFLPIRKEGYALCSEGNGRYTQVFWKNKKGGLKHLEPKNKTKNTPPKSFSLTRYLTVIGKNPTDESGLNLYELALK